MFTFQKYLMCRLDRPELPLLVNIIENTDTLESFLSVSCLRKPLLLVISELILAPDIQRSFVFQFIFFPFTKIV